MRKIWNSIVRIGLTHCELLETDGAAAFVSECEFGDNLLTYLVGCRRWIQRDTSSYDGPCRGPISVGNLDQKSILSASALRLNGADLGEINRFRYTRNPSVSLLVQGYCQPGFRTAPAQYCRVHQLLCTRGVHLGHES